LGNPGPKDTQEKAMRPKETAKKPAIDVVLEEPLTEDKVARLLGRSIKSLQRDRMLNRGCPFIKLGRLVRYRPCDVREHIESNLHRVRT
jgi:hypothetical protein